MSIIEKFKNVDKKNLIILVLSLLIVLLLVCAGIGLWQWNQYKADVEESKNQEESVLVRRNDDGSPKKPSEYNIGIEYKKAMKGNKPVIALFYADWCGYCIRFMPKYEAMYNIYKDDINFTKVNVEDPKYEAIVKEMGITGFPTVFLLDPKYDNKVWVPNSLLGDLKKFRTEVDRFVRIRKLIDKKQK